MKVTTICMPTTLVSKYWITQNIFATAYSWNKYELLETQMTLMVFKNQQQSSGSEYHLRKLKT